MSNFPIPNNSRNFRGHAGGNSLGPNMNPNGPSLSNGPQSRLNPWEPGIGPGVGGNMSNMGSNRSSGGLLPTPIPGLLPTSVQNVQLAVANNVLSMLLPNVNHSNHSQHQNQMPPLLGLNPQRGGLLPPIGYPNPSFQGSHQNAQGLNCPPGRGNQSHIGPTRPRPLLQRTEPYTKMGNRNQREGQKIDGRKDANTFPRNAGRNHDAGSKNFNQQARNNRERKEDVREEKQVDRTLSLESNGVDNSKVQNAYADIPSDFLKCHVCNCKMWDSDTFASHMKDKIHLSMVNKLEEKYRKETDAMRQNMKVEERQKQMSEMNQRRGKPLTSSFREYCTMCNLNFYGNLTAHRKSSSHQTLKAFLHPTCKLCTKEFPTRIDYDHHLLSAGHLMVMAQKKEASKCPKQAGKVCSKNSLPKQTPNANNVTNEAVEKVVKTLNVHKAPSCDKIVVTRLENKEVQVSSNPTKIPEFDCSKEIGMELLQEKTGYLCRCCNRFLSSSADAKTHCRSRFHYDKYIAHIEASLLLKSSVKDEKAISPNVKSNPEPNEEKVRDALEQEEEEDNDNEDEGNWKRRKVMKEDNLDNDVQNTNENKNLMDQEESEEKPEEEKQTVPEADDPASATDSAHEAKPLGTMDADEEQFDDLEKTLLIEPQAPVSNSC